LLLHQSTQSLTSKLIGRYAQRMVIENGIQDGVDFFHMDALSSVVAMKVNCDVVLTVMASSLYRYSEARWQKATKRQIKAHFSRLINAPPKW